MLGNLLKGKNLDLFLKRNRVAFASAQGKSSKKGVLSKLHLSPLRPRVAVNQCTMVRDSDIVQILETSYKTLTYCNLVSCTLITPVTFNILANAKNLQWLCITNNQRLEDACVKKLCENCPGLLHLNFSGCKLLTSESTEAIVSNLHNLDSLNLSENSTMVVDFRNVPALSSLRRMNTLDISYTALTDSKLLAWCRQMPWLQSLNLEGCLQITAEGVETVLMAGSPPSQLRRIGLSKTQAESAGRDKLKELVVKGEGKFDLLFHKD